MQSTTLCLPYFIVRGTTGMTYLLRHQRKHETNKNKIQTEQKEWNTRKGEQGTESEGQESQTFEETLRTPEPEPNIGTQGEKKGNTKPNLATLVERRKGLSIALVGTNGIVK